MTELITSFVDFIEYNVYQNELIYRTIIVVDNMEECSVVKNMFETNSHTVAIFDEKNCDINYDNIDNRILLMMKNQFQSFLNNHQCSSYNLIGICYTLDSIDTSEIIQTFYSKSQENIENVIIVSRNNARNLRR
jgi:hypothetical protein